MFSGMYSAAKAMQFSQQRHEVAANNLAHMNSPGHQREVLTHRQFAAHLQGQPASLPKQTAKSGPFVQLANDFTRGHMAQTNRPLDVVIEGDGFLTVQGANEILYTRNGGLHLDNDGQIVTIDNLPVLGTNGPMSLPPGASSESIVITNDGRVLVDSTEIGQFQISVPAKLNELRRVGETLYAANADAEVETVEGNVRQGYLESSNVAPVNELINLMVASRHYEAAQRTMTAMSETLQQRIDLR